MKVQVDLSDPELAAIREEARDRAVRIVSGVSAGRPADTALARLAVAIDQGTMERPLEP